MATTAKNLLSSGINYMCMWRITRKVSSPVLWSLWRPRDKYILWQVFSPCLTTTRRSSSECSGVSVGRHQKKKKEKRTFLIYGILFRTKTQGKSQQNTHPSFAVSTCSSIFTYKWVRTPRLVTWTQNRTSCQHRWGCWGSTWEHFYRAVLFAGVSTGICGASRDTKEAHPAAVACGNAEALLLNI